MSIKGRFVLDTLRNEGQRMLINQGVAIGLAYKRHSGRLMNGRRISVSGQDDMDARLNFKHPIYERFLDLRKKGGKDRRIHNRFIFGTYSAIARELMYGFTQAVADELAARALEMKNLK